MLSRLVRPIVRSSVRGARNYHDEKPFKYATMDELPLPSGSWQEHYDKMQKTYNLQLIAGIIIFATSFTIAYKTDCLFLNAVPPVPKEERE